MTINRVPPISESRMHIECNVYTVLYTRSHTKSLMRRRRRRHAPCAVHVVAAASASVPVRLCDDQALSASTHSFFLFLFSHVAAPVNRCALSCVCPLMMMLARILLRFE